MSPFPKNSLCREASLDTKIFDHLFGIMNTTAVPFAGIDVCALEEIPDGGVRIFKFYPEQKELGVLLLRSGDDCYSYLNRCPHFGVALAACDAQLIFEPNHWIKCNVHYSRFRWQDGYCETGECVGESLQSLPLEIRDGTVRIQLPDMELGNNS